MRPRPFAAIAASLLLAQGCMTYERVQEPAGSREMWVSEAIQRSSIEKALVVQRTLFAYHFIHDSADLNELGLRDLGVLAAHFAEHPGELNVRRGGIPEQLYRDRVGRVAETMADLGVPKGTIRIVDGTPGGDGVSSARVIQILETDTSKSETNTSTGATSTVSTGLGREKQ